MGHCLYEGCHKGRGIRGDREGVKLMDKLRRAEGVLEDHWGRYANIRGEWEVVSRVIPVHEIGFEMIDEEIDENGDMVIETIGRDDEDDTQYYRVSSERLA